jgi:hypothetical protein
MSGKQRNIRTKRATEEEEEDPRPDQAGASSAPESDAKSLKDKLEETRLIQRQRKKFGGTSADKLAVSGPVAVVEEEVVPQVDGEERAMAKLMNSYVKATTVRDTEEDPQM